MEDVDFYWLSGMGGFLRVVHLIKAESYESCDYFFFFQAEDGIRDIGVTGVQTCALPISTRLSFNRR